ncbi:hypothetical protein JXB02_01050 [Candidatus Woesearchaeota archaeon]|nr:hypothetical protein [Candidatus Woesearchaeota archaeon]
MKKDIIINPDNLEQNSKGILIIHALFEASSHYNTHINNTSLFISISALLLGLLSLVISIDNNPSWMIIRVGYFFIIAIVLLFFQFSKAQKEVEKKIDEAKENHDNMFKTAYGNKK